MANNTETYILKLKDDGFSKGMAGAAGATDNLDNKVNKVKEDTGGLQKAFAGLLAAGIITKGIGDSIVAFNSQEQALFKVRQGIILTNSTAGKNFQELAAKANQLQNSSLFSETDILKDSTSKILEFSNIVGTQFDRTNKIALDLATTMDGDLGGAANLLGKSLSNPIDNLEELSKSGVYFSSNQKKLIKDFQNTNQIAKAQDIILKELEGRYGGLSNAAVDVGTGGLTQLGNIFNSLKTELGGMIFSALKPLIPVLKAAAGHLHTFFGFLKENKETIIFITGVVKGMVAPFAAMIVVTKTWALAQRALNFAMTANPIGIVVALIGGLIAAVVIAWKKFAKFRAVIKGTWAYLKTSFSSFITYVTSFPSKIFKIFQAIPKGIASIFKGIGKLLKAVFTGNFSDIPKLLGEIVTKNPLTAATAQLLVNENKKGKSAAESFSDAYNEEISKKPVSEVKKKNSFINSKGRKFHADFSNKGRNGKKDSKSGLSEIKASAPKTFNINIGSLIKENNINTTKLSEGLPQLKETLTKLLLTAVNDLQIISE